MTIPDVADFRIEIVNVVNRQEKEAFHALLLTKFNAKPSGDGSYIVQCDDPCLTDILQEAKTVLSGRTEVRVTDHGVNPPPLLTKIEATLPDPRQEEEKRSRQVF